MASTPPSTLAIKTNLDKRTLVVGDEKSIVTNFPALADELLACEQLQICGELGSDNPVGQLWRRIKAAQAERLWIIGGDGTINMVGECLIRNEHRLPCWLTPAGTANDLARALTEHFAELRQLSTQTQLPAGSLPRDEETAQLDLLEVRLDDAPAPNCCANMLTLGTSARNTQHVTEEIKSRWGALAYLTQFWRAMGDLEPFSIHLTVGETDQRTVDGILNLFIANGPYCGGGYRIAPPAKLDDGVMDVVVVRQGTTAELAHLGATFLAGVHLEHSLVEHFSASQLVIESQTPSPLTLDGEAFTARRIAVRSLPGYLPVTLVPAGLEG